MSQPTDKELRELDAWIAEHVMGWEWWFNIFSLEAMLQPPDCGNWPLRHGYKKQPHKPELFGTDVSDLSIFKPTIDPAKALEVLKKCAEKAEGSRCLYVGLIDGEWIVGLRGHTYEAVGITLELTICRFAKHIFQKDPK